MAEENTGQYQTVTTPSLSPGGAVKLSYMVARKMCSWPNSYRSIY